MKQGKRTKSAAAPVTALDADTAVSTQQELPDAAYVEQLLAASAGGASDDAPVAVDAAANEVIALPAQCSMRDAVEFKQLFLDRLHADVIAIDIAAVERIDTAFMQVLLALVQSRAEGAAEQVAWLNVNPVFTEAAQLLGLQSVLAIPDVSVAA